MSQTFVNAAAVASLLALSGCTQHAADLRDPNIPKGYAVAYTTLEGFDPCGITAVTAVPADGATGRGPFYEMTAKSDAKGNLTLEPELMIAGRYRVIRASCRGPASFTGNAIKYRYTGRSLPTFTVRSGEITPVGSIRVKPLPVTETRGLRVRRPHSPPPAGSCRCPQHEGWCDSSGGRSSRAKRTAALDALRAARHLLATPRTEPDT